MEKMITVNRPLAGTYRWLHVNGTGVTAFSPDRAPDILWQRDEKEGVREGAAGLDEIRTGMGQEADGLFSTSSAFTIGPDAKTVMRASVRLNRDSVPEAGRVLLHVEEGADLTVVLDVSDLEGIAPALAAVQTRALVEKNAVLRLVTIQRLKEDDRLLNDLGVVCQENARFEYVRLILGGGETFDGCSVALEGDGSSFAADIGYRLNGKEKLDMNYESVHTGRKTACEIRASGVLRDKADKLFRGTIDFRKGCSGSTGGETEDVLMMDETVRNRTVPVILCSEEDVDGSHGATIGRLDEGLVYYLESRGLSREEVYELCAQAKIDAVIRKIPDPETVRRLFPQWAEEGEAEA